MTTTILPDLYEALYDLYNQNRLGLHVSDLLCPREAVFRRKNPQKLTNRDISIFTVGRAIHESIQNLASARPDKYNIEQEVWMKPSGAVAFIPPETSELAHMKETLPIYMERLQKAGIDFDHDLVAHIDLYNKIDNVPIEAKSYRAAKIDQPKPHQAQQLRWYMSLCDAEKGLMLYQLLMHFDEQPMKEFPLWVEPLGLQAEKQELIRKRDSLDRAIQAGDPSLAEHVAQNEDLNWKCNYCKYLNDCQDMRKKAGEPLVRINKPKWTKKK